MGRAIISIIAGVIVAMVTIFVIEYIGHQIFPPPSNLNWTNETALTPSMVDAPAPALMVVLFGYALASLLGAGLSAHLIKAKEWWPSLTVGGVVLLGALTNIQLIPHPTWFKILALIIPLPIAYLGFHFIKKRI